jgi:hypothetical protein
MPKKASNLIIRNAFGAVGVIVAIAAIIGQ